MMSAHPRVSTIIPVHNCAQFVGEAIESARRQTWPDKEVIVVDDGSTDGSRERAESYRTGSVHVLSHENAGAAAARNRGFRESAGEFIQYLDGDDVLAPDKIAAQMRLLGDAPVGTVASCGWGKFTVDPAEAQFHSQDVWRDFGRPVDWLITAWNGGGMMQTACWLIPREVAEKAGPWDESLRDNPADDGEYFSRVLLKGSGVRFCPDAKVYYRAPGEGSLSRKLSDDAAHSLFMNCERYRQHILPHEDSERVRRALARNYANFAYRFHPEYPELVSRSLRRIQELGVRRVPPVGGALFRAMNAALGFEHALRLRGKVRGKPNGEVSR